jgi:hypothetical protein
VIRGRPWRGRFLSSLLAVSLSLTALALLPQRASTGTALVESSPVQVPADTIVPAGVGTLPVTEPMLFSPSVGSDGSANTSVPLWVPKGRAGIQPELSINYNSRAGNGLLGVGFSLSGLSQITHCPQTLAQDNEVVAVNYASNVYCLDGQRLVRLDAAGTATSTSTGTGTTSRAGASRLFGYGNGPYRK